MVIVAWMMQIQKLVDKETEKLPDSAKLHFKFMYDSREEMKWAVCALMVISLICTALALPRNQDMGGLVRSMAGTFYTIPLFMMFASYIGVLVLLFSKPGSLLEWMRRRKITYNVASFFMGEDCAKDYFGNLEQKKETAGTKNW